MNFISVACSDCEAVQSGANNIFLVNLLILLRDHLDGPLKQAKTKLLSTPGFQLAGCNLQFTS